MTPPLKNLPLSEDSIQEAFEEICTIAADDGLLFVFDSISPIRDDDEYGGYKVSFHAEFGKIKVPMSMDVSTGDVITHGAERHVFIDMLDESVRFPIMRHPQQYIIIHYDFRKGLIDKLEIPKECMRISYAVDEVFRLYIDSYGRAGV